MTRLYEWLRHPISTFRRWLWLRRLVAYRQQRFAEMGVWQPEDNEDTWPRGPGRMAS